MDYDFDEMEAESRNIESKFDRDMQGREIDKIISRSPRVIREAVPNADHRYYHTHGLLVRGNKWFSSDPLLASTKEEKWAALTSMGVATVSQILKLEGVISVSGENYKIGVTKGKAFRWKNLQPIIVAILKRELHKEETLRRIARAN